jgi:hypothetical protein
LIKLNNSSSDYNNNKNSKELEEYFNQLKKADLWIQFKTNEIDCLPFKTDSLQVKYELDKIEVLNKEIQSFSNKLSDIEKFKVQHRIHDTNNFDRLNEDYIKLLVSCF